MPESAPGCHLQYHGPHRGYPHHPRPWPSVPRRGGRVLRGLRGQQEPERGLHRPRTPFGRLIAGLPPHRDRGTPTMIRSTDPAASVPCPLRGHHIPGVQRGPLGPCGPSDLCPERLHLAVRPDPRPRRPPRECRARRVPAVPATDTGALLAPPLRAARGALRDLLTGACYPTVPGRGWRRAGNTHRLAGTGSPPPPATPPWSVCPFPLTPNFRAECPRPLPFRSVSITLSFQRRSPCCRPAVRPCCRLCVHLPTPLSSPRAPSTGGPSAGQPWAEPKIFGSGKNDDVHPPPKKWEERRSFRCRSPAPP